MAKTTTALADGDLQFGADETRDAPVSSTGASE